MDDREGLEHVLCELMDFVEERDWQQFHDPKNLAMLLASEAGELLAEYRWVSNDSADAWTIEEANLQRVTQEIADIGIALVLFCARVGIDPVQAMLEKIEVNRANYPVDGSRGKPERPL